MHKILNPFYVLSNTVLIIFLVANIVWKNLTFNNHIIFSNQELKSVEECF